MKRLTPAGGPLGSGSRAGLEKNSDQSALELRGVTFQYTEASQQIVAAALSVRPGEMVALVGPSGSGKTTLLKLMSGELKPDEGTVLIGGREIGQLPRQQLRCRELGRVFQDYRLIDYLTAQENVQLAQELADTLKQEPKRAHEVLEAVGLGEKAASLAWRLSGGEQQRVAIARAIVNKPAVLLADEPTGSLDAQNAQAICDVFSQLAEATGVAVVIATHDSGVRERAGRVVHIVEGTVKEG